MDRLFLDYPLLQESVDQVLSDTKDRRRQDVEQAEVVDLSNSQHRERELHRVLELARKSLGSDYLNRSDSIRSDDEGTTTPNSSPRISLTSPRSPTDKFLTVYKSPRKSPKRRQSIDEDLEVVELSHGDLEEEISQEWLDDDFGLGANKISEPITSHVAQRLSPRSPRITTDMFSAVPHKPEQIREITDAAVELLVTQRRCGEPLSSIKCPDESTSTYPYGELPLSRESDRVYREFLFDYTRDILSSIFPDEEVELPLRSWEKPPRLQRSAVLRIAPQSLDDLKKRVYDEIICSRRRPPLKSRRVTAGSRKPDEVDQLLTEEMYEEEQHWADYTAEEMAVKFRTADSIFQVLWNETLELVSQLTSD